MATIQQCVTKMKEHDMTLNPETCKFVRKSKSKSKSRPSKKNIPPILKKGKKIQLFEEKLPTGLDAELSKMKEPIVKINNKVLENNQNFNNPYTWSPEPEPDLNKLSKAQLKKEQARLKKEQEKEKNIKLATALLPPTNNPSVFGTKTLQQVYDEGRDNRYNPSDWTKKYKYTPAEVRSSINLTRAKKAKETKTNYDLQPFNENARVKRTEEKKERENIKRELENTARENKAKNTRKLQVRKRGNATRTNVVQPSKGRKKEAQVPVATTNVVAMRVQARMDAAIRLKELERDAQRDALRAKATRLEDEGDLLAQELGSNSGSNANLRLNSGE